jgi:hypothetical protein
LPALPTFTDLGLCEPICRALDESGLGEPTAFQQRAITLFLHGRDLLLISPPGPERTVAYLVPLLHRLSEPVVPAQPKEPRALVLTADRDEADAIGVALESFGQHVSLRFLVSSSNSGWTHQDRQMRTGVEILVTTPKRLLDLMREKAVKLGSVEIAVIDDADDMVDQGFEPDLNRIVSALPGSYQTVAFAAAPAPELRPFVQSWMRNPLSIGGPPPAPRKATGKAAAAKQRVSTLKLPDWLDEPPPELMPDWLQDEPGAAVSAPASGAKKQKGTTRRVPTPAEAAEAQPAAAAKKGSGKQPKDDLPAWLDDEPAASSAKKRKGTTRRVPTPAEAAEAQPASTAQNATSGKKPKDELPAWLDDEPAAKAPASGAKKRKGTTRRVPTPAEAAEETAPGSPPPTPAETPPPPKKKSGTRRKGTRTGKTRRTP